MGIKLVIAVLASSVMTDLLPFARASTVTPTHNSVKSASKEQLNEFDGASVPILDADKRDLLWIKTRQSVSLFYVAAKLGVPAIDMANLNRVDVEHRFSDGDWLVLPARLRLLADQLAVLDTQNARRTSPISETSQEVSPKGNAVIEPSGLSQMAASNAREGSPSIEGSARIGDRFLSIQSPQPLSLFDLARLIEEPMGWVGAINGVSHDHVFAAGAWIRIPAPKISLAQKAGLGRSQDDQPLAAALPSTERIWVIIRQSVSLSELARQLGISPSTMASLNGIDTNHRFQQGDWLVIPAEQRRLAALPAVLDMLDARRTPPHQSQQQIPPVPTKGVVRLGDTLFQIAQRYGTTMQEILRLNPGLDKVQLVAGTEIYLGRSVPSNRMEQPLEALPPPPRVEAQPLRPAPTPNTSQVQPQLASPAKPSMPDPLRFDLSLDELVRQGVVHPAERQRIRSGLPAPPQQTPAQQSACRTGALSEEECQSDVVVRWRGSEATSRPAISTPSSLPQAPRAVPQNTRKQVIPGPTLRLPSSSPLVKPLSERETALLQRIRANKSPSWRQYGKCKYNWSNWTKLHDDIRSTSVDCGPSLAWTVGVSCKRLMTNIYSDQFGWQGWRMPAGPDHETRAGEDEMVAALCANLTSSR
jgi:hypothetical protein